MLPRHYSSTGHFSRRSGLGSHRRCTIGTSPSVAMISLWLLLPRYHLGSTATWSVLPLQRTISQNSSITPSPSRPSTLWPRLSNTSTHTHLITPTPSSHNRRRQCPPGAGDWTARIALSMPRRGLPTERVMVWERKSGSVQGRRMREDLSDWMDW